jgi:hypothetical protein
MNGETLSSKLDRRRAVELLGDPLEVGSPIEWPWFGLRPPLAPRIS